MKNGENILVLDCTLRDGGHLTDGVFGERMIKKTIQSLVEANVDIIEVGFLVEEEYDINTARYKTIKDVKRILPEYKGNSKFALMADFIDVSEIEPYDGTIDIIRLSFKRQRLEWALDAAQKLMDKGYKCFINPVNCSVYSDEEYIQVIKKVNKLKPYGFSVVDTFGALRKEDLARIYYLIENNLDTDICIGIHLHENLGLSLALAQHFVEIHNPKRKINIDASLLGMGRTPGNLCIEQIVDYLNMQYGKEYVLEPILDIINDYIEPLKEVKKWGYSVPYSLSAKYKLHRTYAEFLMNKWKLGMKDIKRILSQVDLKESEYYNEEYIQNLYMNYIQVGIDDSEAIIKLKEKLQKKDILVIAPGSSLEDYKTQIISKIEEKNVCIISIGFVPDFCEVDYVWITSIKRYNQYDFKKSKAQIIITSNLMRDARTYDYMIDFNSLYYHNETFSDNSMLMALHFLKNIGILKITVAGFDGFNDERTNFYGEMFSRQNTKEDTNEIISHILKTCYKEMKLEFITPTRYEYEK